jgi:2-hydroxychromene-2-carboxylate isomerase
MQNPDRPPGAASRTEMSPVARRLSSRFIRWVIDPRRQSLVRAAREGVRRVRGARHRIHYFHQPDDPYSHLAAQALPALIERYDVDWTVHVAGAEGFPNIPEPDLLARLARRDCAAVAPSYGLVFPDATEAPSPGALHAVERALVEAAQSDVAPFADRAVELGGALWGCDESTIASMTGPVQPQRDFETETTLTQAAALRAKWGHYSGAMFHCAGEWYWGVDRLHHLERRLIELGANRAGDEIRFQRRDIPMQPVARASELTLEVFPSLRSPYTAISFERTVELAERTGVRLEVRPVLPMVMRGVPATFTKGVYIMKDTLREAEGMGMPFGRMLDPIGEPVRRAYALWPWARDSGRGAAFLAAFLRAAFAEAVDTSGEAGLRLVVERAGLSWDEARSHLGDPAWEAELESNRLAMMNEMGQWGVPSFRLRGPGDTPDFCTWGQDRLWRVAEEIQTRGGRPG